MTITEQNNILRDKVNTYIKKHGIKCNFICECTGIETSFFSRFRKSKRQLNPDSIASLQKFLDKNLG